MQLGARVLRRPGVWTVAPPERLRLPEDVIDAGGSGTTARFFIPLCALTPPGLSVLTGNEALRRRPMLPLLEALEGLGSRARSTTGKGVLPVVVEGGGLRGGSTSLRGDVSSQFLSGLLLASLRAEQEARMRVLGKLVSAPYVDATLAAVSLFGGSIRRHGSEFIVPSGQSLQAQEVLTPGDIGLSLLLAAAVILSGGEALIRELALDLPQADALGLRLLRELGCELELDGQGSLSVRASGELRGGTFELGEAPDLLPVLAALSVACREAVEIGGVAHARFKESDRLSALAQGLREAGLQVEEREQGLRIWRGEPRSAVLDPQGDHRLFMAYCALAFALPKGALVLEPRCVRKSFPGYLRALKSLGARPEVV